MTYIASSARYQTNGIPPLRQKRSEITGRFAWPLAQLRRCGRDGKFPQHAQNCF